MSFVRRSRSVDIGSLRRESYLSQYNRERFPADSMGSYVRNLRRSFTPVREVGDYRVIGDPTQPYYLRALRPPIGIVSEPYHSNINYYQETQPFRKYDVFQLRTWAYPIYKYIFQRDSNPGWPYSYTRTYGTTPLYTPPYLAAESRPLSGLGSASRRGYSGYTYVASDHSYDIASRPYSMLKNQFWKPYPYSSPWYYSYYGNSGLRHYNSFRPRPFTSLLSTYWTPYY